MIRKLSIIILSAALTVFAVWLFWKPARPPAPPAPKVAEAPKVVASKPTALPVVVPKVVAPKVAPAVPQSTGPAEAPPAASGDPQAELNSSLSDIISLIQSGDLVTAFERYAPPDELAKMSPEEKSQMEQEMSTEMSQPDAQQAMQMMVSVLQGMQSQTPTINAAGDRATYQVSDPTGQSTQVMPFSFQKIDGKWYVDSNSMGGM